MQSVSSRVWTRVAVSISYDDNHYITGTSSRINCIYTYPTPPPQAVWGTKSMSKRSTASLNSDLSFLTSYLNKTKNPIYPNIYPKLGGEQMGSCLSQRHLNPCRLFNAKSSLYIYIYIYIYVCVCVCVCLGNNFSLRHSWLNITDNIGLNIFVSILSNHRVVVLIFGWNWQTNFPYLATVAIDKILKNHNYK